MNTNSIVAFLVVLSATVCQAELPCSNKKVIDYASRLAVSSDFETARTGMNILLSLQTKAAKKALDSLKVQGTAQHEIWNQYGFDYWKKPREDLAGDEIKYYNCAEIKKMMSR